MEPRCGEAEFDTALAVQASSGGRIAFQCGGPTTTEAVPEEVKVEAPAAADTSTEATPPEAAPAEATLSDAPAADQPEKSS